MPALTPEQIESYVDASSAALGLKLSTAQRPGVIRFFALALGYAEIVDAVSLSTQVESAVHFVPVTTPVTAPQRSASA